MKGKNTLLILFFIAFFQSLCKGQNNTDHITIQVEDPKATVELQLHTVKEIGSFPDFTQEVDFVLRNLDKLEMDVSDPGLATKIVVSKKPNGEKQLQLSQHLPENIKYIQDESMQLHKAPKDTLIIRYSGKEKVTIALHQMEDLQLLNEINWKEKLQEHADNYNRIKRREIYGETLQLRNKNESLRRISEDKKYFDKLIVSLYTGAGVFKNDWVTHLGAELAFSLEGKSRHAKAFGASFEGLLDFDRQDGQTNRHVNFFTDLFYSFNTTPWTEKPNMMRINLGYLTKRSGDQFEKNTFHLGITKDLGHNLRITPELYFPGKFRKINPGIKISYSF